MDWGASVALVAFQLSSVSTVRACATLCGCVKKTNEAQRIMQGKDGLSCVLLLLAFPSAVTAAAEEWRNRRRLPMTEGFIAGAARVGKDFLKDATEGREFSALLKRMNQREDGDFYKAASEIAFRTVSKRSCNINNKM